MLLYLFLNYNNFKRKKKRLKSEYSAFNQTILSSSPFKVGTGNLCNKTGKQGRITSGPSLSGSAVTCASIQTCPLNRHISDNSSLPNNTLMFAGTF